MSATRKPEPVSDDVYDRLYSDANMDRLFKSLALEADDAVDDEPDERPDDWDN